MALIRLNNQSISSVTALPSGITSLPSSITSASGLDLGKVVKTSRIKYDTGNIDFSNGSSLADSGIDHNFQATSASNSLLHIINVVMQKTNAGGHGGGVTIYKNDGAITEISSSDGSLARMHQDGATSVTSGNGTLTYHQDYIDSTSSIKYSLYCRGDSFRFTTNSTTPLFWTILEIAS